MLNRVIAVDFEKKTGRIKPMHGINGGPRLGGYNLPFDFSDEFTEMGVPYVRTDSSAGEYGLNQFINIHCIFPDFDQDPECEQSYNFLPTDLYIASVVGTGAEIFYRLGESVEPYSHKIFARPPKDIEKWATVCEHIVMHYNEGWANGFKYNIKHWEIWNAPDTAEGFVGDPKEYFELYAATAKRLRERFPKIKIGAYGMRGFYSQNRLDATEEMKTYVPFMQQFFSFVNRNEVPLDFFTWACYTSNPEELAMHIKYARTYLDGVGLRRTKSIIAEYNTHRKGHTPIALQKDFPTELGASLILAQKSSLDMMMYSSSDIQSGNNGLFTMDDYTTPHHYAAYRVMCAYGKLYKLGTAYETTGDYRKELYSLAASDGNEASILLVTRGYVGKVEISLKGSLFRTCSVVKTVLGGDRAEGTVYRAENISISGDRILLPVKKNEIYEISLFGKKQEPIPAPDDEQS